MTREPRATVKLYDEAWTTGADSESRVTTLRLIWTDDGVYVDPDAPEGVRGPEALAAFIEQSFEQYPGLEIVATSDLNVLGDRGWYSWRASVPGEEAFTGVDFVEFAPDGRIARLTNFYDS
jgi:hypothetical protein